MSYELPTLTAPTLHREPVLTLPLLPPLLRILIVAFVNRRCRNQNTISPRSLSCNDRYLFRWFSLEIKQYPSTLNSNPTLLDLIPNQLILHLFRCKKKQLDESFLSFSRLVQLGFSTLFFLGINPSRGGGVGSGIYKCQYPPPPLQSIKFTHYTKRVAYPTPRFSIKTLYQKKAFLLLLLMV